MPRKPKHTIAELEDARSYLNGEGLNPAYDDAMRARNATALWCVEWHIDQRAASKDNPGRPKREKEIEK